MTRIIDCSQNYAIYTPARPAGLTTSHHTTSHIHITPHDRPAAVDDGAGRHHPVEDAHVDVVEEL